MSSRGEVQPIRPDSSIPSSPDDPAVGGRAEQDAVLSSPAELARIVEAFDEEDWFEFLDQMDAVSRRRRRRDAEPERPINGDRKAMADWIARQHLIVDRNLQAVHFLPTDSPPNEIRLIEVNDRLAGPDSSIVQAMEFALAAQDGPFRLFVVDVNGEEYEAIKAGRLSLPAGWKLDGEITTYARRRPA